MGTWFADAKSVTKMQFCEENRAKRKDARGVHGRLPRGDENLRRHAWRDRRRATLRTDCGLSDTIPLPHHLYVLHEAGRRPDKIIETWSAAVRWLFHKIGGAIFKTRSAIYRVPFPF